MVINENSIFSKVKKYVKSADGKAKAKEYINRCKEEGIRETNAGSLIITRDTAHAIAYELIQNLQQMAAILEMSRVLPHGVAEHFRYLSAEITEEGKDGGFVVGIYFDDDLHRDSMIGYNRHTGTLSERTGDGIDNIIALFNNGYDAGGAVYGFWENAGVFTWSLRNRPHLGFMEGEIDRFNAQYSRSVCHAELLW